MLSPSSQQETKLLLQSKHAKFSLAQRSIFRAFGVLLGLMLVILLNITFHAPMGRFQLKLIYCFTVIFHRRPIQHLYVSFL